MSINLSRNTRLWVSSVLTGHDNSNTFEIPIQEDYDLGQDVNTSDVTIDEAGPTPSRGSRRFNDSLNPVDWSFSTYSTPYMETNHYLVDMLLWHALAAGESVVPDFTNTSNTSPVYGDATGFKVNFTSNSEHVLTPIHLYFKVDNQTYLIENAQVSQAEISIDISDIFQVAWSGQGTEYKEIADPAFVDSDGSKGKAYDAATPVADNYVRVSPAKKYLINKLTVMDFNSDAAPGVDDNYSIPLTGASITIANNITYLTPSTLSEVDKPIGSFTGSFEVTGSINAYLRTTGGDGTVATPYGAAELLRHMQDTLDTSVINQSNIVFNIGGKTAGKQVAVITIPLAHITLPTLETDDVMSTTIEFKGLGSSADMQSGDEIFLDFKAQ